MKNTYTIMALDTDHIDEICEDIKYQYENGIAECALFSMTLVPEGNPPVNKARILCDKYLEFKKKLSADNIPNGVLVQASIGHGWILGEMFPYQRYTNLIDGENPAVVCPYDEGFREYIADAFKSIAECAPDHIMFDDDFRLIGRAGSGCACPQHMKRFNELSGEDITREELLAVFEKKNEKYEKYSEIFIETQRESVIETAHIIRDAIDSVDPSIPGSFCAVGLNAEFADEISIIMAGKGNPVIMRINNGYYTAAGTRFFTSAFFKAASQIAKVKDKVDIILAETDTCPQTRYSTSASSLHTHFTGSIIEGCAGAKQWITKLNNHEPQSGKAYRKILSKYDKFYTELAKIVPDLKWHGLCMPVLKKPSFSFPKFDNFGDDVYSAWGLHMAERLGLPMYFSSKYDGVLSLDGNVLLSDEEIKDALKGTVLLSSSSAKNLIDRGFGDYIGVDLREWTGIQPTRELIYTNGGNCPIQKDMLEIVPLSDDAEILSMVQNSADKVHYADLFPGVVMFKNSLSGTVITFAGTPDARFGLGPAFSFLSLSRKAQFIDIMKKTGNLPAYYSCDEEIYFRCADTKDGKLFCSVINLGLDPIEQIELYFEKEVSKIEKLMPDGTLKEIAFEKKDDIYIIDSVCNTLEPVIIFAS